MSANYGDVFVSLPRCFRGQIVISTSDERVSLSPALKECAALISDVPGARVYFVGDRPRRRGPQRRTTTTSTTSGSKESHFGEDEAPGSLLDEPVDQLSVAGKFTSVRINWDDEEELPMMGPSPWMTFISGADRFFKTGRVA
jgi:hypothetical protein